jgi:hypothetical protein
MVNQDDESLLRIVLCKDANFCGLTNFSLVFLDIESFTSWLHYLLMLRLGFKNLEHTGLNKVTFRYRI